MLADIGPNMPHPRFAQCGLEQLKGRVSADLGGVHDCLALRVDRWTMVVQKDPQRGLEFGRLGGHFVDRDAVQVERAGVRGGLDLDEALGDGRGGLGIEDGDVVGVGSAGDVEVIGSGKPGTTALDVRAREVEKARGTVKPHVLASFELRDGAAGVRGVVECTTDAEDIVDCGARARKEVVRQRGEGDRDRQVGDQARHPWCVATCSVGRGWTRAGEAVGRGGSKML